MWLVYHDLRNDWANLRQTFRDCWGQAVACPRPKRIQNVDIEKIFFFSFFPSICNLTLSDCFTHDDSLGFEDCRFATHLLNCIINGSQCWVLRVVCVLFAQ